MKLRFSEIYSFMYQINGFFSLPNIRKGKGQLNIISLNTLLNTQIYESQSKNLHSDL